MAMIWKAAAITVLTVILGATIGKKEKDIAIVLIAVACCGIVGLAVHSLSDVIAFIQHLSNLSNNQSFYTGILLKIVGVAVVAEITSLISMDAGSSSLEKAMQLLGNTMILSLSLPLFERLIEIVQEILNFV